MRHSVARLSYILYSLFSDDSRKEETYRKNQTEDHKSKKDGIIISLFEYALSVRRINIDKSVETTNESYDYRLNEGRNTFTERSEQICNELYKEHLSLLFCFFCFFFKESMFAFREKGNNYLTSFTLVIDGSIRPLRLPIVTVNSITWSTSSSNALQPIKLIF